MVATLDEEMKAALVPGVSVVRYTPPKSWIQYDPYSILAELTAAKAAMLALTQIPYQRSWADELQKIQLKREVAGTSRIEGAEFTEKELDAALRETPEQLETRSQKQAAAAVATYRWIAQLPNDRTVDGPLICEIHARLVTGCDDDHCGPGKLRSQDQNVTFGAPRHRGAEGGDECAEMFEGLCGAVKAQFRDHDPLLQALALHYHFAAMHPFLDGNGRTARALEALMLQRVGLRTTLFIAMSNYYYEEKNQYLTVLNETRSRDYDLTAFFKFGLKGIETQCRRLFAEIRLNVAKALYQNTMVDLFRRMKSPRKRVMSERQMSILMLLLRKEEITLAEIEKETRLIYHVTNPYKALIRDLNYLISIRAITHKVLKEENGHLLMINLEWPTTITETEFFKRVSTFPKDKTHGFLSS